jgi:hypothetical protein
VTDRARRLDATITPELREYVETPDRYSYVPSGVVQRYADERVCILQGPVWASVSGIRVPPDEVEALVAEVRRRVPAAKEPVCWIGPSAEPPDLWERLRDLGLREPRDRTPLLHGLVVTQLPEEIPPRIEVRPITTFDEFAAAAELRTEAFEVPPHRAEQSRARRREDFEDAMRVGVPVAFLALLDGRPAATAMSIPSSRGAFLVGGCTAPWARGRGLYRALVRARWDDAVQRGTPALVTHAKPDTSLPILRRLGFDEVCRIRRLEDLG